MSMNDLIMRVDSICKKYDNYEIDQQKELNNIFWDDGFGRLYGVAEADLEAALQKLEMVSREGNMATVVAMNAEIRRTKARLLEELPKLRILAPK
ncbi:syntaxin-71-like [Pyrus x bretschneideri]|uniref:syntaxin-71-like n=1 Tax=Pyrus x bretschneideri TaxID=225117 RepID=UPI00202F85D8|nr:syntaxin-71-like [Pyrus x bretschneideri]